MHSINWLVSDLWISQFCELIFHGNNERVACQHTDRPIDQVELKLCYSKKRHWCKNQISWFSYAYICYTCVSRFTLQKKTRLVVSSHLNNMFVKLDHLKNKKSLKPPAPRKQRKHQFFHQFFPGPDPRSDEPRETPRFFLIFVTPVTPPEN